VREGDRARERGPRPRERIAPAMVVCDGRARWSTVDRARRAFDGVGRSAFSCLPGRAPVAPARLGILGRLCALSRQPRWKGACKRTPPSVRFGS
jgi:hypothetical protein